MAVLNAIFYGGCTGGAVNPYLCPHLTAFDPHEIIGGAFDSRVMPPALLGSVARHRPVYAHHRHITVRNCPQYSGDYYHRIHVTPPRLDMGNLVSAQTTGVKVWNAHLTAQTVTGVSGLDAGIEVSPPAPLPLLMPALQENTWHVTVTPDGPAVIDVALAFIFSGIDAPSLPVTGNRIVPWGFVPDWSDPVTEILAWLTSITKSHTGAQQRRALRISPRRSFKNRVIVEGAERNYFDLALAGWGARQWALPIWPDVQWTSAPIRAGDTVIPCRTAGFDFQAGGLAMLIGDSAFDCAAVEISTFTTSGLTLKRPMQTPWPVGTRLYPVRTAELSQQPDLTRHTDQLWTATVEFNITEPSDWPAVMPTETYRGLPVFSLRPDESENLTTKYERLILTLDNAVGLPAVTDTAGKGFPVQQHRWVLSGRDEHAVFRSLAYALRGMQKAVWIPTHADDLTLAAPAVGRSFPVQRVGYARFGVNALGRRDIRVELKNGTALCLGITGATDDGKVEILGLSSNLLTPIYPADVNRISYMGLYHLAGDEVSIEHITDADGVARTVMTWSGLRDELEVTA